MSGPVTYKTVKELLNTGAWPEGVRVITSYDCARGCKFCYQKQRHSVKLGVDVFREHLRDLQKYGPIPIYFTFQGGEVTTHPAHTFALCSAADLYFPQVFRKSITSNGYGELAFYQQAKLFGVTHITLSLHGPNARVEQLACRLAHDGFYTVRVNCFLHRDHLEKAAHVYQFCRANSIQLTLCEDLRPDCASPPSIMEIKEHVLRDLGTYRVQRHKHQDVWTSDCSCNSAPYRFWVYHHIDHYDYNNLIVLPDGTLTMTFDDVMVCAGAGESDAA